MTFDTRAPLAIQASRTINVGRGSGGGPILNDWQLPASNFIAAKRPLMIVQPHVSEMGPDSFYLWAEPGVRYEAPICAIFGAFPYHFSVDGPEGMTVGSFFMLAPDGVTLIRGEDYGVVRFDVPASGLSNFSYTVTITDQELNSVSVTVNVTVDQNKFIHVADTQAGTGDGSPGDPLGSFRDMWLDDSSDDTYAGKIIRFRGGNYELFGDPVNHNKNVRFNGAIKPKTWIAYPGETPVFDCQQAKILMNDGNMDDCAFIGLALKNARQDVGNAHFIWLSAGVDRPMLWRNTFNNINYGEIGNDNPASIFISGSGSINPVILSNKFTDHSPGNDNGVAAFDTYSIMNGCFDDNELSDSQSNYGIWLKGQHVGTCLRQNRIVSNFSGIRGLALPMGKDGGAPHGDGRSHGNEICYNTVVMQDTNRFAFQAALATTSDDHFDQWVYRNTFKGRTTQSHSDSSIYEYEKNIYTDEIPNGTAITLINNQNVSEADIDIDGLFINGASNFSGEIGAQITRVD